MGEGGGKYRQNKPDHQLVIEVDGWVHGGLFALLSLPWGIVEIFHNKSFFVVVSNEHQYLSF